MIPLRSLNLLALMSSHLILSIFPFVLFWWLSAWERDTQLVSFTFSSFRLLLFSGKAAASAPSPDRQRFNVFFSLFFSIHLGSPSLSEAKEEKVLKNLRIHIKWSSSGVSWGPPDLGVRVRQAFCFFWGRLLPSCHILFHSTQDQRFVATAKHVNNSRS